MHREERSDGDAQLRRECRTFTRYLTAREPDEYALDKYVSLQLAVANGASPARPIDLLLLRAATSGVRRTRIADAYARLFRPHGVLRRKLVLVFAILENSGAFHRDFTAGGSASLPRALLGVAGSLLAFLIALALGTLLFAPRHAWLELRRHERVA